MSGYKRVSFYELCRLCASSIQKEKTHIFQDDGRKIELQNKIQTCLSLNVTEDDFLPKVVCTRCVRQLEICFTFREECLVSESMLSTYFKNYRYTDDFKKSGKVYIKDTKPPSLPNTSEGLTSTTNTINATSTSHTKSTPQNPIEAMPFYTLQLPTTIVSNPNLNSKILKPDIIDGKLSHGHASHSQVAYNLNLLNTTALKNSVPLLTKEVLNNIIVNSNGEVINIAQLGDLEAVTSQVHAVRSKKLSKTKRKHNTKTDTTSDENIIKIDLTDDHNNYDLCGKYDKLPHIKSTHSTNNKYDIQPKLDKNGNTSTAQNQTQTVIFPVSEYQNNFSNYNTITSTYSQPNPLPIQNQTALIPNSNVICNPTTTSVDPVSLNLNIQELQNNYTVIASNTHSNNISSNNITNNASFSSSSNTDQTNNINIPQTVSSNSMSHSQNPNSCQSHPDPNIMLLQDPDVSQNHAKKIIKPDTGEAYKSSNGIKTHVCDICHKGFKRREHLYQHVKLHTGFRPYRCDVCNKAFMRKEHLFRHSTLHSGQKNYPCDTCGKSFSRNDNLLKHKKTHEKQSSYTCEICQKVFVMKHYYQAHRQSHGDKCYVTSPSARTWETCKT